MRRSNIYATLALLLIASICQVRGVVTGKRHLDVNEKPSTNANSSPNDPTSPEAKKPKIPANPEDVQINSLLEFTRQHKTSMEKFHSSLEHMSAFQTAGHANSRLMSLQDHHAAESAYAVAHQHLRGARDATKDLSIFHHHREFMEGANALMRGLKGVRAGVTAHRDAVEAQHASQRPVRAEVLAHTDEAMEHFAESFEAGHVASRDFETALVYKMPGMVDEEVVPGAIQMHASAHEGRYKVATAHSLL